MEPKTTGKRIVSKGEYVQAQGKRMSMGVLGVGLQLLALPLVGSAMWLFFAIEENLGAMPLPVGVLCSDTLKFLFFGVAAYFCFTKGYALFSTADETDPGVPLTRANTADLPAPESLVRASEEPRQAQEGVLLRAATEEQPGHEEQLLRAAGGPE